MFCKLKSTAFLLLFVLLSFSCFSQSKTLPGYIITSTSDTLRGDILENKVQPESINFKETGNDNFKEYTSKDLLGFGLSDSLFYESKEIAAGKADKTVFLRVIVDGPLKLYSGKGIEEGVEFYLQESGSPVIQLYQNYYKGTIASIGNECEKLGVSDQSNLRSLPKYTASSLADFVQKYSSCKYSNQESKVYLNHSKIGVYYGLRVGVQSTDMHFGSSNSTLKNDFDRNNNLSAGIFLNIHMAGKGFSVQPELNFVKRSFESLYVYTHPTAMDYKNHLTYEATQVQIPLLLKYSMGKNTLKPFINAGPSLSLVLSNQITMTTTYETGQTSSYNYNSDDRMVGYVAGAGLTYSLSKRNSLLLEIRYSRDVIYNQNDSRESKFNSYQLSTAITL